MSLASCRALSPQGARQAHPLEARESGTSSRRRRKIREELKRRVRCNEEAWKLQQELLVPGAHEELMEAALRLLPADEYEAVVEERALEGACAYPPCLRPAAIAAAPQGSKKRWAIDVQRHEVHDQHVAGRFCSRDCMKRSQEFSLRLQPDPAYCRPASAIQASRRAVVSAASKAFHDETSDDASRAEPQATGQETSAPEQQEAQPQQQHSQPQQQQQLQQKQRKLPAVRRRAVVRFSRQSQSYTVQYDENDGSAGSPHDNPDEADGVVVPAASPDQLRVAADTDDRLVDSGTGLGRDDATCESQGQGQGQAMDSDDIGSDAADSSEDDNFLDMDTPYPVSWSGSPFVRAWGVLTNWLSDIALAVIRGARVELDDDGRPTHKARREVLAEILSARLPGELTFLAPRFHDVIAALSLHQTLPSVTESQLYDLLAALILSSIYEVDEKRGEPGWRLLPGAKDLAEKAAHEHHHHHEHQEEHSGEAHIQEHVSEHATEEALAPAPAPPSWFRKQQMAVDHVGEQAGKLISEVQAGAGALVASALVALRNPVGIEVVVPYAIISGLFLWWRLHEWNKANPTPSLRPVSPLAPQLQLNDARPGEEPFEAWTTAFLVFFFGVGLGLGLARAVYRWSQGPSAPPTPPVVITKVEAAPERQKEQPKMLSVETKRNPAAPLQFQAMPQSKSIELIKPGGQAKVNKPKTASAKRLEAERLQANDAAGQEDVEGGFKHPEEYSVWTPQTSWTTPGQTKDDPWTPQTSWGESGAMAEAAAKEAADAAQAGH